MKIAICGLGYVGLTSAACLLKEGHEIRGVDVSESKVRELEAGCCPIFEPGQAELLEGSVQSDRLQLSTRIGSGQLDDVDIVLVCVGTPSAPDGSHNLGYIAEVSRQIAASLTEKAGASLTVVYRSTVHPGTIEKIVKPIIDSHSKGKPRKIQIVYNPEFLRESTAIADYFSPPRIVIDAEDGKPNAMMDAMSASINAPRFVTMRKELAITKLVDKSFHTMKIAFAYEIGRVCRKLRGDTPSFHKIFVSDTKLSISPYYLRSGSAFGGSCLSKAVRALTYLANQPNVNTHLVDSLICSNEAHKHFILGQPTQSLQPRTKVLLNGLSFKKNSDDIREGPLCGSGDGASQQRLPTQYLRSGCETLRSGRKQSRLCLLPLAGIGHSDDRLSDRKANTLRPGVSMPVATFNQGVSCPTLL